MKKQIYTFFACLFALSFPIQSSAQSNGFFGKKTYVDFSMKGNFPAFVENDQKMNIEYKSGQFQETRKKFDYGYRIGINRNLTSSFGIGIEAGFDYFKLNRSKNSSFSQGNGYTYGLYNHESYKVQANAVLFKLIFSSKSSLMPMGLSHQVGFGVSTYKIKEQKLKYNLLEFPEFIFTNNLMGKEKMEDAPKTFTFLYAIQLSTPLTKSLLLNYGLRYTLNMTKKSDYSYYNFDYIDQSSFEKMNASELTRSIKNYRGLNLIQFQLGLTFAF